MVHHVQCSRYIFVEFWLWHIVRHVVQEIDVPERPSGEVFCLRSHLEILKIEIEKSASVDKKLKTEIERPVGVIWGPTSSIISAQLLCFRGTITSSTSSSAIQSYLCNISLRGERL